MAKGSTACGTICVHTVQAFESLLLCGKESSTCATSSNEVTTELRSVYGKRIHGVRHNLRTHGAGF